LHIPIFIRPLPLPPKSPLIPYTTLFRSKGFLAINGQVYFPVYWTPQFGMCPEANYPPRLFHYKTVDLTDTVYSEHRMPDDQVKRSEEHTSNSSHVSNSYAVFCLKKKKIQ